MAIVLSVPQSCVEGRERERERERRLKAGTRLNGNWGIPERRTKTGALVSTESSSAERANTRRGGGGRGGSWGGLRVDVRCLATHPFSQHPLWTPPRRCHVTNTDDAAASTFFSPARTSIFHSTPFRSTPAFLPPPSSSLLLSSPLLPPPCCVRHSTQLRPLFRPPMLNHCPFFLLLFAFSLPPVWDPLLPLFSFLFLFLFFSTGRGVLE